jgi:hypothetical protein
VCVCVCMCVCMYVCVCMFMCVCICVCVCRIGPYNVDITEISIIIHIKRKISVCFGRWHYTLV